MQPDANRTYLAIDLKSFYASVECAARGLDPLTTNLVVADPARTQKTICLAVSPSMKALGIAGRPRLFEVMEKVKEVNRERERYAPGGRFAGASSDARELKENSALALDYITAPPRMSYYIRCSTAIYDIYLKYIAPEDIHVYSIDEVFIDVTGYLHSYRMTARELAMTMIREVLRQTGITAAAGIGTNLYLCKVAMDIVAKHVEPDSDGVRIAELDERSYREKLWGHQPLTDFWRVGRGYGKRLAQLGLYTMGDIARCSIGKDTDYYNEELLYRTFGVNAELLIDHAWGWEPCTIAEIKAYKPQNNSLGSGQVLQCAYSAEKAKLVTREMADLLVLDLVDKELVTDQIVLTIGYDVENLTDPKRRSAYKGPVHRDYYGRLVPEHAHGTVNFAQKNSSTKLLLEGVMKLYDEIVDERLLVRRISVTANHVVSEYEAAGRESFEQLNLFTDYEARQQEEDEKAQEREREKRLQKAMLAIKKRYGKNAVLKGMNLEEGATAQLRNNQIGGHKA